MADRHIQIVFSNPGEGREDEFNEWYTSTHIPEVLAIPGMVSAQRFVIRPLAREVAAGQAPEFKYLSVYETEGDPDVIMAKISEGVRTGAIFMSDSFDKYGSRLSWWEPVTEKIESKPES